MFPLVVIKRGKENANKGNFVPEGNWKILLCHVQKFAVSVANF
jgi:hypothetical protein